MSTAESLVLSVAVIAGVALVHFFIRRAVKRRFGAVVGHMKLVTLVSVLVAVAAGIFLLHTWGIIPLLLEALAAMGVVTAVVLVVLKDIWLSDVFAGFAIIGDPLIDVGTDIEVGGVRGRILEITLTRTKVALRDGRVMLLPNRRIRDGATIVAVAPAEKDAA